MLDFGLFPLNSFKDDFLAVGLGSAERIYYPDAYDSLPCKEQEWLWQLLSSSSSVGTVISFSLYPLPELFTLSNIEDVLTRSFFVKLSLRLFQSIFCPLYNFSISAFCCLAECLTVD